MNTEELVKFCRQHSLSFQLAYSEVTDSFQLVLYGPGEEYKTDRGGLTDVISWVIAEANKHYQGTA